MSPLETAFALLGAVGCAIAILACRLERDASHRAAAARTLALYWQMRHDALVAAASKRGRDARAAQIARKRAVQAPVTQALRDGTAVAR